MSDAMKMQPDFPIEVRAEAARIADRTGAKYEDLWHIQAAVAHKHFLHAIEPLIREKGLLYGIHRVVPPSPDSLEAEHLLDEMIAAEARRLGIQALYDEALGQTGTTIIEASAEGCRIVPRSEWQVPQPPPLWPPGT